jgi:hypothetical protein
MDKCEKCDLCLWNQGSGGGGGGGGSSTLAGLTDVDISNPSDGQTLVYDAASEKWVNGSGGGLLTVHRDANETLDKTWQQIADALLAILVIGDEFDKVVTYFNGMYYDDEDGYVVTESTGERYATDSANGYPVLDESPR